MLMQLSDQAEIVIVISAADIDKNKVRGDLGITYDEDVLRLIEVFTERGLYVGSVCTVSYTHLQPQPFLHFMDSPDCPALFPFNALTVLIKNHAGILAGKLHQLFLCAFFGNNNMNPLFSSGAEPVSYTHLDVYKRQADKYQIPCCAGLP